MLVLEGGLSAPRGGGQGWVRPEGDGGANIGS